MHTYTDRHRHMHRQTQTHAQTDTDTCTDRHRHMHGQAQTQTHALSKVWELKNKDIVLSNIFLCHTKCHSVSAELNSFLSHCIKYSITCI